MARKRLALVEDDDVLPRADDAPDTPPYDLDGRASVPVSRKAGVRWHALIDEALQAYTVEREIWDQTYDLYRRTATVDLSSNTALDYRWFAPNDTDENFLRENIRLLLRTTYSRNPKIEISSEITERKELAKCLTQTLAALYSRKTVPGINARSHMRRWIAHGHLTNFGILKLNYQPRMGSLQEANARLGELQRELSDANLTRDLDDLYAELEQLEDDMPVMSNAGISLANPLPHRVLIDPNCTYADLSDCDWLAEELWLSKEGIRRRYMERDDDKKWVRKSDGKPGGGGTTAPVGDGQKIEDTVVSSVLADMNDERAKVVLGDKIQCWLVWDRLARQVSLYSDETWEYPLWVWDDRLGLSRFYQHFVLSFNEPIDGVVQPGEPGQYIGHQREVNRVNRRKSYIRRLAYGALIFNSKVLKGEDAERIIKHLENPTEVKAFGAEWDPDKRIEDVIRSFVPEDFKNQALYDTGELRRAIDRSMTTNPAMRGEQFKTNTTNQAIEEYKSGSQSYTGEQTDIIEDASEELAWSMCELIVSKFSREDVAALIGRANAEPFINLSVEEFNTQFGLTVVSGSTEKPSSEAKKREAVEIAQSLGQVGQAAPMTTMKIIMRMFQTAFSEFNVTGEDFSELAEEVRVNATKGQSATPGVVPGTPSQGGIPSA